MSVGHAGVQIVQGLEPCMSGEERKRSSQRDYMDSEEGAALPYPYAEAILCS